jgi:Terpene synthase family 2, C-terminal metal binding
MSVLFDTLRSDLRLLTLQPKVHSAASRISGKPLDNAVRFGVINASHRSKLEHYQFPLHAAMVHPLVTEEQLEICSDWHVWLWTMDDRLEEGDLANLDLRTPFITATRTLYLNGKVTLNDGHLSWLADIRKRILVLCTEYDCYEFDQSVLEFLEATSTPNEKEKTDLDAYLIFRKRDSACKTVFALIKLFIPTSFFSPRSAISPRDPVMIKERQERRLKRDRKEELANLYLSVFNDLVSYDKEKETPRVAWNILSVYIASGAAKDILEAIQLAIQILNQWGDEFMTLNDNQTLLDCIIGSCYWSLLTPRYQPRK